jgi:hypothetical protein
MFTSYSNSLLTGNSTWLSSKQPRVDETLVVSLIETGIKNPEVQTIIKHEVVKYLKSPEGRASMAEAFKSPEMKKSLVENLHSPELQATILELMSIPEFRRAIIDIIKDTPEMRILFAIAAAIVPENQQQPNKYLTDDATPASRY